MTRSLASLLLVGLAGGAEALAAQDPSSAALPRVDLPCGQAENGAIQIDGLREDWRGVEGAHLGGDGVILRCNVDDQMLYLLVEVRDGYLVRTAKAGGGEDHLDLEVSGLRLQAFPTDGREKERLLPPKRLRGARMSSALTEEGWAVEIGIPVTGIPGYSKTTPELEFSFSVSDCNSKATLKRERSVAAAGALTFEAGTAALEALYKQLRVRPDDVYFKGTVRVGRHGTARVLLLGKHIAFVSDEYVFAGIPFAKSDLKEVRIVDLAGDGRDALLVRYQEQGGGGAREVLAIYRVLDSGELKRVFAMETGKRQGKNRLETRVSLARRGKATDLVFEAQPAVGFSAQSYQEQPAGDMLPILLPWGDERRATYRFRGDEYHLGN